MKTDATLKSGIMSQMTIWGRSLLGIVMYGVLALRGNSAVAQIVPDRTLPNNSNVTVNGSTFNIDGGTTAGRNLFHSFQQFSVPTGGTASFNNGLDIQNIFSRVTGGSVSNIDGIIKANGTANLFLINPNGIVFGKNASLNVGGSFVASTASSLKFADGFEFSANAPQTTPLLTISVPIGLQYGSNPGNIVNQSVATFNYDCYCYSGGLEVPNGKTLAIIGGNVSFDGGGLVAPGGHIELGGVAEPGIVGLNVDGNNLHFNFPDGLARADIFLNKAQISADTNPYTSVTPAGTITISAHNLSTPNLDVLAVGNTISALGSGKGGEITINSTGTISLDSSRIDAEGTSGVINIQAGSIFLSNSDISTNNNSHGGTAGSIYVKANDSLSLFNTTVNSRGNEYGADPGNITFEARSISLTNNSYYGSSASTTGLGGFGGSINVKASDSVSASGYIGGFYSGDDGGNVNINTGSLKLTDGGGIAVGQLGSVNIKANSITVSGVSLYGEPSTINSFNDNKKGGIINISTGSLSVTDGAYISSEARGQSGAIGGDININADSVIVSGVSSYGDTSGLFASTGGNININAHTLRVANGAVVGTGSLTDGNGGNITVNANNLEFANGGQMFTTAFNTGNAGDITINASNSLTVSGSNPSFGEIPAHQPEFGIHFTPLTPASGLLANTFKNSTGLGGKLSITTGQLTVRDGGQVSASSQGTGDAGDINITARSLKLDNGSITTTSRSGQGGNIDNLQVQDLLLLRNHSQISTSSGTNQNGSGNGGNITINAKDGFIVAVPNENSDITANAFNGQGGKITINATGIYGMVQRNRLDLERLHVKDLDPGNLSTNDITAFSQQNPSLNGTVLLNTPDIDPSRGLVTLPTVTEVTPKLVVSGCAAASDNSFTITGRGGLPPSPSEPLSSDVVWIDARLPAVQQHSSNKPKAKPHSKPKAEPIAIVTATGWVFNKEKGEVTLISSAPSATGLGSNPATCSTRHERIGQQSTTSPP